VTSPDAARLADIAFAARLIAAWMRK
jgi:hypothetical protein